MNSIPINKILNSPEGKTLEHYPLFLNFVHMKLTSELASIESWTSVTNVSNIQTEVLTLGNNKQNCQHSNYEIVAFSRRGSNPHPIPLSIKSINLSKKSINQNVLISIKSIKVTCKFEKVHQCEIRGELALPRYDYSCRKRTFIWAKWSKLKWFEV